MRRLVTIIVAVVLLFPLTANATQIGPGPVSGHWYASGNPYNVLGFIRVDDGYTLTIHEGVEVVFHADTQLRVFGLLEAIGTEQDSIFFSTS
ncbi:MAG: hypothetical protein ACE5JC_10040, partial [Candidatus Zixiibacteriota bacterium]